MTTTLLLRIAAVVSLLFTAGHTMGGRKQWSPIGGNAVLEAMTTFRLDVMGVNRSYLDFYMGFGWAISAYLLMQTVLIWQVASLARTDAARVRPMIAVFALATLANGLLSWRMFFAIPTAFLAVIFVVLVAAYMARR